ncbi:MAG: LysM peptidoglycan-binding domain-containing protein, partial [Alphaproteobacteria bacterium]|nr:LysM peptidoglycan-binding domain-containing protein [Alphaproteobacteria bacterium]
MKKIFCAFLFIGFLSACDLQPRIASIPDDVGDFISSRYPTLLAEPDSEIYKTAVADYGMYASASDYGNGDITDADYVLYSPADDYMMPAQDTDVDAADAGMPTDDVPNDVVAQSVSMQPAENVADEYGFAPDDNIDDLMIPDYKTDDLVVAPRKQENAKPAAKSEAKKTPEKSDTGAVRAPVREITVVAGDTLYSLSRKYSVPVNDLAVMNKIGAPFALSVGQKLRVPDIGDVSKSAPRVATSAQSVESKTPVQQVSTKMVDGKKSGAVQQNTKKTVVAQTDVKQTEIKKAEVKKTTSVPKVEPKKTDAKKAEVKKSDVKQVNAKKADTKPAVKTDVAKKTNTTNKTSDAKNTTAKKSGNGGGTQKMVARSSSRFSWPVRGKILSGYGAKSNGL